MHAWRSSRNVDRSSGQHYMPAHTPGQQWLFIHVTWRALDQSRSRISDSDITKQILTVSLDQHWKILPLSCATLHNFGAEFFSVALGTSQYLYTGLVITLTFHLWPWKPFQQCSRTWWMFMTRFVEIPTLSTEISHHAKQVLRYEWQMDNGQMDEGNTSCLIAYC